MRILHFIPRLDSISGGPSRSVPYQCVAALSNGTSVSLAYLDNGFALAPETVEVISRGVNTYALASSSLFNRLPALVEGHNVVHVHGMWSPSCYWVSQVALSVGRALVISPHGMLEPWSLTHKQYRKRLAMWLYQRRMLMKAQLMQATAESEAISMRKLGIMCPIAVIPHGVSMPTYHESMAGRVSPKRMLFLSRIHPKKGLLQLVRAVAEHKAVIESDHWNIVVAGPDTDGYQAVAETEASSLGVRQYFDLIGNVDGQKKWDLYRSASLFVLPTFSENFGLVVAEALGSGVPVITTQGAPWSELESHDCGWWHPIGQQYLNEALGRALLTSPEVLRQMGERGIALVRQHYNINGQGPHFQSMYAWACNGGTVPDCFL